MDEITVILTRQEFQLVLQILQSAPMSGNMQQLIPMINAVSAVAAKITRAVQVPVAPMPEESGE